MRGGDGEDKGREEKGEEETRGRKREARKREERRGEGKRVEQRRGGGLPGPRSMCAFRLHWCVSCVRHLGVGSRPSACPGSRSTQPWGRGNCCEADH